MAEGIALTLRPDEEWRRVGSAPEGQPIEFILRSFDEPVLFAAGKSPERPEGEPVVVAPGVGARLEGLHFFARAAAGADGPARILVRGA